MGYKGDNINIGNLNEILLAKEDSDSFKINIIEEGEDKNAANENIIKKLKNKDHKEKKHCNNVIKKDDYYRLFRTNFVFSWIFTNSLIIFLFTSNIFAKYFSTHDYNPYLIFGRLFI
ncbi:hypothetical protein C2G38_2208465 [Gigaspora rosea]|uniref:Uncharacterized protein n=1 Tax=Gigaspora rosea TaxID=44941 RepID=A0A397UH44_9GLOM|nr:hypothetical protein C2G38_2208465 [Gigaspora rosea]